MKHKPKLVATINQKTDCIKLLYNIRAEQEKAGAVYILDASNYYEPASLIAIAYPDVVQLNLKMTRTNSLDLICTDMQEANKTQLGMITKNVAAYYMSLCKTFTDWYQIEKTQSLQTISATIIQAQLN